MAAADSSSMGPNMHTLDGGLSTSYEFVAGYLRARFGDTERGASLVEYALLVALIAVVCIAAVTLLGKNASSKFKSVGSSIQ
jgi:pilus assembly protein Flp/PilA